MGSVFHSFDSRMHQQELLACPQFSGFELDEVDASRSRNARPVATIPELHELPPVSQFCLARPNHATAHVVDHQPDGGSSLSQAVAQLHRPATGRGEGWVQESDTHRARLELESHRSHEHGRAIPRNECEAIPVSAALEADVLDIRRVVRGDHVGYRLSPVAVDGTLVMIGAGSANGVVPLAGDLSPFHFARTRLALVEPPHMHTSMAIVPSEQTCPQVGDWVDVQRPLTMTTIDELLWK